MSTSPAGNLAGQTLLAGQHLCDAGLKPAVKLRLRVPPRSKKESASVVLVVCVCDLY